MFGILRWLPGLLGLLILGCGTPLPPLHPLTGTLMQKGEPVTKGGGIIFLPVDANNTSLVFNAALTQDGRFEARTEESTSNGRLQFHKGIPAGRYIAIYHPASDGSKSGLEVKLPEPITVEPGENTIPLELPDKLPEGAGEPRDDDDE